MTQYPPAIAHHGLGCHGAVGDDLANLVAAVGFRDVIDHKIAFLHAEIDVEIGH